MTLATIINRYGAVDSTRSYLKLILVALLSYWMGYSHGSSKNYLDGELGELSREYKEYSGVGRKNLIDQDDKPLIDNKSLIHDETLINPFEQSTLKEYLPNRKTDGYNYFHRYVELFSKDGPDPPKDMDDLPMLHIWPTYFEAYHNHWQRFRGQDEVVFMEIGVQSGGKIAMLRDYFGPGFIYVGIDINDACRKFDNNDWVNIEIGDSVDPTFLEYIKKKYPKVDVFLDDGGHTMDQQRVAFRELLPHVQPNGVYMCEDLSTSWAERFSGMPLKDSRDSVFLRETMYGLIHRTIDWLNSGYIYGGLMTENFSELERKDFFGNDESLWKEFQHTVKSVHVYSQIVVYEKGHVNEAFTTMTVGSSIPYQNSKNIVYEKTDWNNVLSKVQSYTNSHW